MSHEISTYHTFTLIDFETTIQNKVKEILLSVLYDTNNLISDVTEEIYNKSDVDIKRTLDEGHDYDYYWKDNDKGERIIMNITEYTSYNIQKYFNELLSKEKTIEEDDE